MPGFVAKRLVFLIVQLIIVIVGVFLLLRVLPADPASRLAGIASGQGAILQAKRALGINVSVWTQLGRYLSDLGHGSMATSWNTSAPVGEEVIDYFPVTIQLIVMSFILATLVAIPVGRAAASKPGGRVDRATLVYSLFAGAQPEFWWGLVLVFLFAIKLKVFPVPTGLLSPDITPPPTTTHFLLIDALIHGDFSAFVNAMWHYALPVVTLAFVLTGPLVKMTRQSVLTVVQSDYLLYARAAGLPQRALRRMMLRNALAPVLTLTGILFGFMLGGAVLIEYVFSLNGLGLYALNSTLELNYPSVQGAVIVMTAFALLVYLCIDVIHATIDPRVRLKERSTVASPAIDASLEFEPALTPDISPVAQASRWAHFRELVRKSHLLKIGLVLVSIAIFLTIFGPMIGPKSTINATGPIDAAPSAAHLFGTDSSGLDVFSRTIAAPRVDVTIAVIATVFSLLLGSIVGLLASFFRGRAGELVMRGSDTVQAFPLFVLAIVFVVLAGRSDLNIIVVIALLNVPIYLRLIRSEVISLRERTFVEAARANGDRPLSIAFRHVLPNAMTPGFAQAPITFGFAIIVIAGLSFIGAGVRPPTAEWGSMINAARSDLVLGVWWTSVFPGIALSLTVFGFAIVGDALQSVIMRRAS